MSKETHSRKSVQPGLSRYYDPERRSVVKLVTLIWHLHLTESMIIDIILFAWFFLKLFKLQNGWHRFVAVNIEEPNIGVNQNWNITRNTDFFLNNLRTLSNNTSLTIQKNHFRGHTNFNITTFTHKSTLHKVVTILKYQRNAKEQVGVNFYLSLITDFYCTYRS